MEGHYLVTGTFPIFSISYIEAMLLGFLKMRQYSLYFPEIVLKLLAIYHSSRSKPSSEIL